MNKIIQILLLQILLVGYLTTQSQDITLKILWDDTLDISYDQYKYLGVEVSNMTADTIILPGFKVAEPACPSGLTLDRYYLNSDKIRKKHCEVNSDSLILLGTKNPYGAVLMFVRKIDNDSLAGLTPYFARDFLADEARANFDTTETGNPLHLDPVGLFCFQRRLILPPKSSFFHTLFCDFRCFNLRDNENYKFFLIYSFNYKMMRETAFFGERTWTKSFIQSSIKSNEIILTH